MQDFKINSQLPPAATQMPTAANPASGVSPAQEYQQQNKKPQTPLQGSIPNTAPGKKFKKPSKPAALGLPSIDPSMFGR